MTEYQNVPPQPNNNGMPVSPSPQNLQGSHNPQNLYAAQQQSEQQPLGTSGQQGAIPQVTTAQQYPLPTQQPAPGQSTPSQPVLGQPTPQQQYSAPLSNVQPNAQPGMSAGAQSPVQTSPYNFGAQTQQFQSQSQSPGQPPQGQQYQAYTPGQPPQTPYQGYQNTAQVAPKKKKTGLIVGLIIGAVLLIAAAIIIPVVVLGVFSDNKEEIINVTEPDIDPVPDPDPDPDPKPDPEPDPTPNPVQNDRPSYTNSEIGIGFDVPDDWTEHESATYPDELLEVWPDDQDDLSFIWIDRFPGVNVADYEANESSYLLLYSFEGDFNDLDDFKKDSFTKNGQDWTVVSFNTYDETGMAGPEDQWYYVMCCYTDMPDSQGLLMVAEFVPVDAPEDIVTEEYFVELNGIIDSFVFL